MIPRGFPRLRHRIGSNGNGPRHGALHHNIGQALLDPDEASFELQTAPFREPEIAQNAAVHFYDVRLEDQLQLPAVDRRDGDQCIVVALPAVAQLLEGGRQPFQRFVALGGNEKPRHAPN